MKNNIQIPYLQKKAALEYMQKHYEQNVRYYQHLTMPQADVQVLVELDTEYVHYYGLQIKLLEQIMYN